MLPDTEYPVDFEYAGQDTGVVQITVNEGSAIPNELIRGCVDGKKYGETEDGSDPAELAGAVIGLFRPETEEFTRRERPAYCDDW